MAGWQTLKSNSVRVEKFYRAAISHKADQKSFPSDCERSKTSESYRCGRLNVKWLAMAPYFDATYLIRIRKENAAKEESTLEVIFCTPVCRQMR